MSTPPPVVVTPPAVSTASAAAAVDNINSMDTTISEEATRLSEDRRRRRRQSQAQVDAQRMASLPLGWTRVVPRNKRGRATNDGGDGEDDCCNIGPSCRHRRKSSRSGGLLLGTTDATTTASSSASTASKRRFRRRVSGHVIFCLHESNPDWFQGYFFPSNTTSATPSSSSSSSSWGLLAVQKELDECLQCSEGGYRVIDLTVTMSASSSGSSNKKKVKLLDIEWTGGDMMDLKGNHADIEMQPDRLLTGQAAASSMERFFSGLLRTLRAALDEPDMQDLPVLSLLPDAAIVTGSMTLFLPIDEQEEDEDEDGNMTMTMMTHLLDQD
jgi:hypothetical protein